LSSSTTAPHEVTRFLREYPPFDAVAPEAVERVAAAAEVEFHRAGDTIIAQGSDPLDHLWVVRSGEIEIIHDGRVLDLLGEGELFGHASMLSGLPTGFEARAAGDTLTYRIPAAVAREPLAQPAGMRFVARSLLEQPLDADAFERKPAPDPTQQPAGSLLRGEPVICQPDITIREAAQRMAAAPSTSVVVQLGNGSLGILTDHDLRTRVVAAGLPGDAPVSEAMSAPAYAARPDRLGGEVLLEMLDRGIRHFPIVSATGQILGVLEDLDVVAAQSRSPFFLRQRIARAETVDEVVSAAAELSPMAIALHEGQVAAAGIMAVYAVVVDALTRRLLELTLHEMGGPDVHFAWLSLGSQARREMMPSSDVDSAIVCFEPAPDAQIRPRLLAVAERVVAGLKRCGLRPDPHGASASNAIFVRSLSSWQEAARSWIEDPTQQQALILVSVIVDSRPVWGIHAGTPVTDTFRLGPRSPALLRLLGRFALSYRPPTGFLRGLVVEHSGEYRGRLDLKHGGVIPIVDLARWAGMAAGITSASTRERLRAAAAAGTLSGADAHTLEDAIELVNGLRLEHQVEQLRAGREPDDYIDLEKLSRLTRTYLKDAFRAVASIQKQVAAELNLGVR
jgi:CBS domain-containing protein